MSWGLLLLPFLDLTSSSTPCRLLSLLLVEAVTHVRRDVVGWFPCVVGFAEVKPTYFIVRAVVGIASQDQSVDDVFRACLFILFRVGVVFVFLLRCGVGSVDNVIGGYPSGACALVGSGVDVAGGDVDD